MKTPTFPMEVKTDSSTVTIYEREFEREYKTGTGDDTQVKRKRYVEYRLAWYQKGTRHIETSSDFLALRTRADEVLSDLNEGREPGAGALRISQRNEYLRAVEIVRPTGVALDVAATHFAKAVKILGSDLVVLAAQEYVRRNLDKVKPKLVSEAVEDFIAEQEMRERQGKLSHVHVARQTTRLRDFAKAIVMNAGTVTADDLDRFLDGLRKQDGKTPVSIRTRDNWADEIVAFYEWAKLKRYVPDDYNEPARIKRLDSDTDGPIEIYTPEEMAALLGSADKLLTPFLAIGAFAGLRTSEFFRLDWSDVRIENGNPHIVVRQGKVKKRGKSRRIVEPLPDNLIAFLKPYVKASGPVWEWSEPLLYKRLRILAAKAQKAIRKVSPDASLAWKSNALRHSFISYRVAKIKDVPQVALESGNSPQIINSNYRELVTEQDAQRWFSIMPPAKASKARGKARKAK